MKATPLVYLDNCSGTPLDPRVHRTFDRALRTLHGNPSNKGHALGRTAAEALERARTDVADSLGTDNHQVVFTSGATESLNLAMLGMAPNRIVVNETEHKAILELCRWMALNGTEVVKVPVDTTGRVDLDALNDAFRRPVSLVILQSCNSETGVIQPVDKALELAMAHGVPLLCDASQSIGRVPLALRELPVDLLVLASHKIYGPPGAGALLIRQDSPASRLRPLMIGGGQEFGLRPGTENVPEILGFAKALKLAVRELEHDSRAARSLRDEFERRLTARVDGVMLNGADAERIPNVSNFSFTDLPVGEFLKNTPRLAMSTRSACSSDDPSPSHVLRAMGRSEHLAGNAIRVSFGRFNKPGDARLAVRLIETAVQKMVERGEVMGDG